MRSTPILPPSRPLTRLERLAAAVCLAAVAVMCSTACGFNAHLMDSPPVKAPPMPPSQPARLLGEGDYRLGPSAAYVLQGGAGGGQGGLGGRFGLGNGFEFDLGLAVPDFQGFGLLRYQLLGQKQQEGLFLAAEGGAAFSIDFDTTDRPAQPPTSDYFAGLSLGKSLDKQWQMQLNGRVGSEASDGYVEAGTGVLYRATRLMDVILGAGYRAYQDARPNAARVGLSFQFGNAAWPRPLVPDAVPRLQALIAKGDLRGAYRLYAQAHLADKDNPQLQQIYVQILQAQRKVKEDARARKLAARRRKRPAPPDAGLPPAPGPANEPLPAGSR